MMIGILAVAATKQLLPMLDLQIHLVCSYFQKHADR